MIWWSIIAALWLFDYSHKNSFPVLDNFCRQAKKKYVSVVFVIFSRAYPFVGAFPIVLACKMATTNNNVSNKLLDNQLQLSIPTFHPKCGQLVTLSSNKRTAKRSNAAQEFNHGLIFSHTHLVSNQVCRYLTSVHLSKFLCSNSTDIKAFRMKVSDGSFVQFDCLLTIILLFC